MKVSPSFVVVACVVEIEERWVIEFQLQNNVPKNAKVFQVSLTLI